MVRASVCQACFGEWQSELALGPWRLHFRGGKSKPAKLSGVQFFAEMVTSDEKATVNINDKVDMTATQVPWLRTR